MRSIDRGFPVITRIQSSRRGKGHIVVVKGYETGPNIVWLNDPGCLSLDRAPYENFSKNWRIRRKYGGTNQYGLILKEP